MLTHLFFALGLFLLEEAAGFWGELPQLSRFTEEFKGLLRVPVPGFGSFVVLLVHHHEVVAFLAGRLGGKGAPARPGCRWDACPFAPAFGTSASFACLRSSSFPRLASGRPP